MIFPIGKWLDETSGEYKDRFLIFGHVVKDAAYKQVGSKQTPMLTLCVSPGREEDLLNIKMWSWYADKYKGIKKGRTVLCDAIAESREYNGKTYTDYTPLVIMFDVFSSAGGQATQTRARKDKTVEPESQEGFFDVPTDDLPF